MGAVESELVGMIAQYVSPGDNVKSKWCKDSQIEYEKEEIHSFPTGIQICHILQNISKKTMETD